MKRYKIWNKTDTIITPTGEVLSPSEWIARHPIAEHVTTLCGAGEVNGSDFEVLDLVMTIYAQLGCDFSTCKTDEEKLAVIEAFDEKRKLAEAEAMAEAKAREDIQADSLASIAASLEFQNMMSLPDVEV